VEITGGERCRDAGAANDGRPADDAQQAVFQVRHYAPIENAEHQPKAEHHQAKRGHSEACQRELIRQRRKSSSKR